MISRSSWVCHSILPSCSYLVGIQGKYLLFCLRFLSPSAVGRARLEAGGSTAWWCPLNSPFLVVGGRTETINLDPLLLALTRFRSEAGLWGMESLTKCGEMWKWPAGFLVSNFQTTVKIITYQQDCMAPWETVPERNFNSGIICRARFLRWQL